jgi:hypothetical protein
LPLSAVPAGVCLCAVRWQIHTSAFREKPIFPSKPINSDTSPDLSLSLRCAAINVAAISTRNLSALVSQKPLDFISSHVSLTGFGRLGGGSGSAVVTSGSFFLALGGSDG